MPRTWPGLKLPPCRAHGTRPHHRMSCLVTRQQEVWEGGRSGSVLDGGELDAGQASVGLDAHPYSAFPKSGNDCKGPSDVNSCPVT